MKKETIVPIMIAGCSMLAGLAAIHAMFSRHINNVAYQPYPSSEFIVSAIAILFSISTLCVCDALFTFIGVCIHKRTWAEFATSLAKIVKSSVATLIILCVLMHTQIVSSAQGIEITLSSLQKAGAPGSFMTWSGIKISLWGMGVMCWSFYAGAALYALLDKEPESTEPKRISYEIRKR